MSEYVSIKTLQFREEEFRRELEMRRVIKERLDEQAEVYELERRLALSDEAHARRTPTIRWRWQRTQHRLHTLFQRHLGESDPARR